MDTRTKIKLLRENAAAFRERAKVDRPGRDQWLRSAKAADDRADSLESQQASETRIGVNGWL